MTLHLTDWRGAEYGTGDLVLYPRVSGRCVEMMEGTVVEVYQVYYDDEDRCQWVRLEPDQLAPFEKVYTRDLLERVDGDTRMRTEYRVRIRPTGRGSRDFHRGMKDAVLTVHENVTKVEATPGRATQPSE